MRDPIKLSRDSQVTRVASTVDAEVDGEVVALKIDTGAFYALNPVGSRIWKLIAEPRFVADMCNRLVAEYAVEPALCEAQVLALLEELRSESLLRVVAGPSAPEG